MLGQHVGSACWIVIEHLQAHFLYFGRWQPLNRTVSVHTSKDLGALIRRWCKLPQLQVSTSIFITMPVQIDQYANVSFGAPVLWSNRLAKHVSELLTCRFRCRLRIRLQVLSVSVLIRKWVVILNRDMSCIQSDTSHPFGSSIHECGSPLSFRVFLFLNVLIRNWVKLFLRDLQPWNCFWR